MMPVMTIAVAGLVDASDRLGAAANRTASSSARFANAINQATGSGAPPPSVAGQALAGTAATRDLSRQLPLASDQGQPMYVPSYAEDVVAMRSAVAAYKANAKLVRVSGELGAELARLGTAPPPGR